MNQKRTAVAMGQVIRELRLKRKLTQLQLAKLAKLSIRQINSIETGKRPPYLDEVFPLAEALEVQAWVLTRRLRDAM